MSLGGIYEIVNTVNGRRYIGSAVDLHRRFRRHRAELRQGSHHSIKLQHAWDKHGEAAFQFSLMMTVEDKTKLTWWEQRFFEALKPEYNICPTAGSALGYKHTAATKSKMSETSKGKPKSPEHRATMSRTRKGKKRPRTPEHQAKLNATQIGRKASAEARANMSKAHAGKPLAPEHKANIGRAGKGKKRTPETRKRMSKAQLGNKKAAGHKNSLGYKHTPESKTKMSVSQSLRRAAERLAKEQEVQNAPE